MNQSKPTSKSCEHDSVFDWEGTGWTKYTMEGKPCSVHYIAQTHDAYSTSVGKLPGRAITSVYYHISAYNYYRSDCCTDKLQRPPKNAGVVPSLQLHKCSVGRDIKIKGMGTFNSANFKQQHASTASVVLDFLEQLIQRLISYQHCITLPILFMIHSWFTHLFNIWKHQMELTWPSGIARGNDKAPAPSAAAEIFTTPQWLGRFFGPQGGWKQTPQIPTSCLGSLHGWICVDMRWYSWKMNPQDQKKHISDNQ